MIVSDLRLPRHWTLVWSDLDFWPAS